MRPVANSDAARLTYVRGWGVPSIHSRAMTQTPDRGSENSTDEAEAATLWANHVNGSAPNRALISDGSISARRYPELRSTSDGSPVPRYPNLANRYAPSRTVTTMTPRRDTPRNPAIQHAATTTHTRSPDSIVKAASVNVTAAAISTIQPPRLCARFSAPRHSTEATR